MMMSTPAVALDRTAAEATAVGSWPQTDAPRREGAFPSWDRTDAAPRPRRTDLADLASRVLIGSLFLVLAIRILVNFSTTGRVTGLLLLASELLVVVLTIVRRPAVDVDRRWRVRLIATMSMVGPPLARPISAAPGSADLLTAALSAVGLLIVVGAKMSLGRSFGLVPANRGIVSSGLYQWLRHPIYTGYLITHVGFVIANPTAWNLALLGVADAALLVRALYEEETLCRDHAYANYCGQVRWRMLPGLF